MDNNLNANMIVPPVRSTIEHRMPVTEKELVAMLPQVRPYSHIFYTAPASVADFKNDFLPSKLWRMNNLYKVQTKDDGLGDSLVVDFIMKRAQLVLYVQLVLHPRVVVLKSRQIGISTVTVLMYGDDMIIIPHLKVGIVAQNQDAANELKNKISFAFDNMDDSVKAFFNVHSDTDNDSTFGLNNGSSAVARLSFRSGTLHRFAWTEVGKIANRDPARVTETLSGSMQAISPSKSNWVVNESTAEGNNYFKTLYESAEASIGKPITNKEVRPLFFSWLTDVTCNSMAEVEIPDSVKRIVDRIEVEFSAYIQSSAYRAQIGNFVYPDGYEYKVSASQQAWMVGALKELNHDLELFYREYPHTPASAFFTSNIGLWYRTAMTELKESGRIVYSPPSYKEEGKPSILYNPDYEVIAVSDIGLRDRFFILYAQIIPTGFFDSDGLEIWDIRILGEDYDTDLKTDKYAEMIEAQPYPDRTIGLPHDGNRETVLKDSISVEDDFMQMGFDVINIEKSPKILPPILRTRRQLYYTRIDGTLAPELLNNLDNYKKKYDKTLQQYTDTPVHDIHSHGADAFRYVATFPLPSRKITTRTRDIVTLGSGSSTRSSGGFSI